MKLPNFCTCEKPDLKRKNGGVCGCNWCLACDGRISCVAPLSKLRPFETFITFPINVEVAEEVIKSDDTVWLKGIDVDGIGEKPEPLKIYYKEKPKETYISPFTGRVM